MLFLTEQKKFLLSQIGKIKGKYILDNGCGLGELSSFLAKEGAFITAIDIRESIRPEYLKIKNLAFKVEDGTKINYSNKFDVVVSLDVMVGNRSKNWNPNNLKHSCLSLPIHFCSSDKVNQK